MAQFGSITRAARSLGMPIATVSRRLSVLESALDVALVKRTTRRMQLTAQGRDYFSQYQRPLNLLEEAERVLTRTQKRPEGLLRITAPVILAQEPFRNLVSTFLRDHARIRVDPPITNLFLDLIAENVVVARRLGKRVRHVLAPREYIKARPLPADPADLKGRLHDVQCQ